MFPITMSFTVSTPAELARLVAATGNIAPPEVSPLPAEGGKKADPKPGKPAATQAAAAGQTVSTENASASRSEGNAQPAEAASAAQPAATPATPAPTAAVSGADAPLDYDKDVKPAFLKLVQTKGRAAGRKIIDAFAPTKEKLSEAVTTPEQYAQALKLIAKEMA